MAYDEGLAERVRDVIGARPGVKERRMFSTLAWFVDGNMACGVRDDELYVRLGPQGAEPALAEPHTRPFETPGGKAMNGIVMVAPEGVDSEDKLSHWVDAGAEYAASLPPK